MSAQQLSADRPGRATHGGSGTGTAHGKTILLGEHAVVYGSPAIAVPLPRLAARAHVDLDAPAATLTTSLWTGPLGDAPARLAPTLTALRTTLAALRPRDAAALEATAALHVTSDVPHERGLGSSAAVAAAVVRSVAAALRHPLDPDELHELVQASERVAHGSPSGLDARSVVADGPLWFHHGEARLLPVGVDGVLVVADTGVAGDTRSAVAGVRARRDADPAAARALDRLGDLVTAGRDGLAAGDLDAVGSVMDEAHGLLADLTVSSPELDGLTAAARAAGALGAKLTGGGRGGCAVALCADPTTAADVAAAVTAAGATGVWTSPLTPTTADQPISPTGSTPTA
ncbi:mevalonate kinase [Isoptericola jiangsuensis]|uniref:Mevalonate kinase n=1 Tax=Isoptericola jiangsuensis TaxID=548579 RepID=A0A2A9EYM5_9MICO|nr:mevalonate kinase [Isoptericola jiangsuensis]PFG43330.1 mevalonate kinase [Isoptericola jiangsuensis]